MFQLAHQIHLFDQVSECKLQFFSLRVCKVHLSSARMTMIRIKLARKIDHHNKARVDAKLHVLYRLNISSKERYAEITWKTTLSLVMQDR